MFISGVGVKQASILHPWFDLFANDWREGALDLLGFTVVRNDADNSHTFHTGPHEYRHTGDVDCEICGQALTDESDYRAYFEHAFAPNEAYSLAPLSPLAAFAVRHQSTAASTGVVDLATDTPESLVSRGYDVYHTECLLVTAITTFLQEKMETRISMTQQKFYDGTLRFDRLGKFFWSMMFQLQNVVSFERYEKYVGEVLELEKKYSHTWLNEVADFVKTSFVEVHSNVNASGLPAHVLALRRQVVQRMDTIVDPAEQLRLAIRNGNVYLLRILIAEHDVGTLERSQTHYSPHQCALTLALAVENYDIALFMIEEGDFSWECSDSEPLRYLLSHINEHVFDLFADTMTGDDVDTVTIENLLGVFAAKNIDDGVLQRLVELKAIRELGDYQWYFILAATLVHERGKMLETLNSYVMNEKMKMFLLMPLSNTMKELLPQTSTSATLLEYAFRQSSLFVYMLPILEKDADMALTIYLQTESSDALKNSQKAYLTMMQVYREFVRDAVEIGVLQRSAEKARPLFKDNVDLLLNQFALQYVNIGDSRIVAFMLKELELADADFNNHVYKKYFAEDNVRSMLTPLTVTAAMKDTFPLARILIEEFNADMFQNSMDVFLLFARSRNIVGLRFLLERWRRQRTTVVFTDEIVRNLCSLGELLLEAGQDSQSDEAQEYLDYFVDFFMFAQKYTKFDIDECHLGKFVFTLVGLSALHGGGANLEEEDGRLLREAVDNRATEMAFFLLDVGVDPRFVSDDALAATNQEIRNAVEAARKRRAPKRTRR